MFEIRPAQESDLPAFFDYLSDHLSDNGQNGTALFQPLSRDHLLLSGDMKSRFTQGLQMGLGDLGWRRLWVVISESGSIVGHIDLRSHSEAYTRHRALLGMGVDRNVRRNGLGRRLLEIVAKWASNAGIEQIDLWVLSANEAAMKLYLSFGFEVTGEVCDMFRIDGKSYSTTMMSRAVAV